MKVALNPNVSFKANLIDEAKKGSNQSGTIQVPIGAPLNNRPVSQEEMDKNLAEFNQALKDGQPLSQANIGIKSICPEKMLFMQKCREPMTD